MRCLNGRCLNDVKNLLVKDTNWNRDAETASNEDILPCIAFDTQIFPDDHALPVHSQTHTKWSETWNRMACAAHTLQLSAREAINHEIVQEIINNIRETSKYFRKSAVSAMYLLKEQKSNSSNEPKRLLIDV